MTRFTRTVLSIVALATGLMACSGGDTILAPQVEAAPQLLSLEFYQSEVELVVGDPVQYLDVQLRMEGKPENIPTSAFKLTIKTPGVVSVNNGNFYRENSFSRETGKAETTFRQTFLLRDVKVGDTDLIVTHNLAPNMEATSHVKVSLLPAGCTTKSGFSSTTGRPCGPLVLPQPSAP